MSSIAVSQTDERKWSIDPRQTNLYDPTNTQLTQLPIERDFYFQPNQMERMISTPSGVLVVAPTFRILPRTNSYQSEMIITRHPLNPLILFGSSNAFNNTGTLFISEGNYRSTDGGNTWFGTDTLQGAPITNHGGDPGPAIDKDGRIFMTHLGFSVSGMYANYSTNNGSTWSSNYTIVSGSQDKNFAASDDSPLSAYYGRTYCVWSRFNVANPPIAVSFTTNGGVSWSTATNINTSVSGHYSQGCDIRTGPNGEVYVVWAAPISASPFTEDFAGFAKSVNGGVSWTVTDNAFDMNGIRGTLFSTAIRVNSFPRIDVDRTCGPRAGWIYVVISQKNLSPAGTDPDIVLHKSTDGGTTWSSGIRVNQDALNNGKTQYFPAIRVDESGGVNIVYYDNRGTTNTDTVEVWMSRSIDGGTTWTDFEVSDHRFKPKSIGTPGIATGYQGDYIGITSNLIPGNSVNGNQRIFPLWCSDFTGIYQGWMTKVELLPSNPCWGCEDFSNTGFTPDYYYLEYTGNSLWTRQPSSAYGSGNGSAMFNFYNASSGTVQSLTTSCEPVPSGYYLTFDEAYASYNSSFGPDTLLIELSTNGGVSYITRAVLKGVYPMAGELNTAPPTLNSFVPTASQWAPKIYALFPGTNRIRFKAKSGFGNNLHIDNICIVPLPNNTTSTIGLASQGMFITTDPYWRLPDTVRVYLHRSDFPNIIVDSAKITMGSNGVSNTMFFTHALDGSYYRVVKHRNSILTWSSFARTFTRGVAFPNYNFIQPEGQAYGNNQAIVSTTPFYRGMYSGDVDQDKVIDGTDVGLIDNAAANFISGYVITDLTGDNFVDGTDFAIADNNAALFVQAVEPPGAALSIIENEMSNGIPVFNSDFERMKYEIARVIEKQKPVAEIKKRISYKEYLEMKRNEINKAR